MSEAEYEVVVVGGSWAGLAAALQLGRARRRVLVLDAGRPRNRFARSAHGFPGQDGRPPGAVLTTFREQVLGYPSVEHRTAEAMEAARDGTGFVVTVAGGPTVRGSRLVLATGVTDELPALPGLAARWGVTVLHCPYCHGYEVADRRLGVLAVGEHSLHQALLLPDWSSEVTLFSQGFVPTAEQAALLAARGVRLEPRAVLALEGTAPGLTGVRLAHGGRVAVDALFVATRTRQGSSLAARLGCVMDDGPAGPVVRTDERRSTTVPGVFCAGDAARARHAAAWAVADGVTAGIAAHQSLVMAEAELGPPGGRAFAPRAAGRHR